MIEHIFQTMAGFIPFYENGTKQLFKEHIEPVMKDIDRIHADYISAFIEVRKNLKDKEVPISNLLDFLKDRRHELLALRSKSKQFSIAMSDAERRIVRNGAWKSFKKFCDSVSEYLEASSSIANYSWYTDFIQFMKVSRLGNFESNFFVKNVFGNDQELIQFVI